MIDGEKAVRVIVSCCSFVSSGERGPRVRKGVGRTDRLTVENTSLLATKLTIVGRSLLTSRLCFISICPPPTLPTPELSTDGASLVFPAVEEIVAAEGAVVAKRESRSGFFPRTTDLRDVSTIEMLDPASCEVEGVLELTSSRNEINFPSPIPQNSILAASSPSSSLFDAVTPDPPPVEKVVPKSTTRMLRIKTPLEMLVCARILNDGKESKYTSPVVHRPTERTWKDFVLVARTGAFFVGEELAAEGAEKTFIVDSEKQAISFGKLVVL